jgi:hypothetical protein
MPESDTPPLPIARASQNQLHSFCALLHCHAHPWEERGGGGNFAGREGGNRKCEMMMMGDDDEMNNFLHSLYNGILRARG